MVEAAGPDIQGIVDHGDHTAISGWAYNAHAPDEAVDLEVLLGSDVICTLKADGYRKDLRAVGYGNGCHAFTLPLPSSMFTAPVLTLHVRAAATGADLVGSPVTVVNRLTMLDGPTRSAIAAAIATEVDGARSAGQLHQLATWLLQQFDLVYQRQASLEASATARVSRFFDLVAENGSLSDTLRRAAEAVMARYPVLNLGEETSPEVSVLIPAFNNFACTYRCLEAILTNLPQVAFEVIVIDDGSTDETVYAAMLLSGGFRVVRTGTNKGFLDAILAGAQAARGEYLFFLNNDTEVQAGWLDELVETFNQDQTIGIAGAKLIFPDGRLQESGGIIWRQGTGYNFGRGQDAAHCDYCYMRDTDYVSAAGLLISREIYDQVSGLSPEFGPGYYEDTDLCFKVRKAGYRVVVQPHSVIIHHEGVTSGTDPNGAGMKRFQRVNQRKFLDKWFVELQSHGLSDADPTLEMDRVRRPRLLFIDETVPTPDQDAGSNAALEHMKALQRLGYQVGFVGADNMARISPYTEALEKSGIRCYYAPYYWSVEQILRTQRCGFDVIYIHRLNNMVKYEPIIRRLHPRTRIMFNVADLHHLRLAREARINENSVLAFEAEQLKHTEIEAIRRADIVLVHSSFEKAVLQPAELGKTVNVIPWVVRPDPVVTPFAQRFGMALIGGFNHSPNVDAARFLAEQVMPLVEAEEPGLHCLLIGSQMPESVLALRSRTIQPLGHVPDIKAVLQGLRLTVAPLRYGAGLKGKVLTSLAFGLPCVMTPCAAEGMSLPSELDEAIAEDAAELAASILAFHRDEALNARAAAAGLRFVEAAYSEQHIDDLLRSALA